MKVRKKLHLLVLADTDASGEWIATQRLFDVLQRKSIASSDLIAFSSKRIFRQSLSAFYRTKLIFPLKIKRPFRIIKLVVIGMPNLIKTVKAFINNGSQYDSIIITNYLLLIGYLCAGGFFSSSKKMFIFQGVRNFVRPKPWDLYGRTLALLEWLSWMACDTLLIPSEDNAHFVRRRLGILGKKKKLSVLPNVVPDIFFEKVSPATISRERQKYGLNKEVRAIIFCGRITYSKGIAQLVEAFTAPNSFKNVRLFIAYPSVQLDKQLLVNLKKTLKAKNRQDDVIFIANATESELRVLYHLANCLILPSDFEFSSLAMLESLASGIPVISTKVGDAGSILDKIDQHLVLKNNSPKEITKALDYILHLSEIQKHRLSAEAEHAVYGHKPKFLADYFLKLFSEEDS